jgi:hypothetical protein
MRALKTLAISALIALGASAGANGAVVDIYDGYNGSYSYLPLSTYFSGQGYTVNNVGSSFSSLSGADLAILSYPVGLGPTQLTAIDSYVSGGGRLVINSDGQGFEAGQSAMNAILTSLGSSIVNVDGSYDSGYNSTSDIVSSPFTAGVSSVNYGYTSLLTGGNPLVYGNGGQLFIAYQGIGNGFVFAIADIDTADSTTFTGDNPTLYCDFGSLSCAGTQSVPEPVTLSLFGAGLAGAAALRRRKKKRA